MPDAVPAQTAPFTIPASGEELIARLVEPVKQFLPPIPTCSFPENVESAHPFRGGEAAAQARIKQFLRSGFLANYKNARRGLAKDESSTKLSAYLAQGCITARQVHRFLVGYENGTEVTLRDVDGYGRGEHEGTEALRAGLLWRDYMRLCHQKFKSKFFCVEGFRGDGHGDGDGEAGEQKKMKWKSAAEDMALPDHKPSTRSTAEILERFNAGTTGIGLIDASQRELLHTGYTSNRARQNVASFLSRHLGIDWRYGAEWYEMLLVDYDVSSNWANWQYMAGVGNDPRSGLRIFNPVKQALEYDKDGQYIKSWVPELRGLGKLENVFQAWTASAEDVEAAGLGGNIMATDPVKRIAFTIEDRPRTRKRSGHARRGRRGGRGGKGDRPENGAVATGDTVISAPAEKEGAKFSPPSTAPNIHLSANSGAGCSALPKGPNPSPRADGQRPYRRGRGRGRPRGSSRGRGARGRGG
jgi:deoxyribodipyrimidine photo-lyase